MRSVIVFLILILIGAATAPAPAGAEDGRYCYVTVTASLPRRSCYGEANCRLMAAMIARHMAFIKLVDRLRELKGRLPVWSTRSIRYAQVVRQTIRSEGYGEVRVSVTLKAPMGYLAWRSRR
jgi:hypothetical protein